MWNVYERLMAEAEKLKEPPRPIPINEIVRTPSQSRSSNSLETVRLENMEEPTLYHRTPVRVVRELRSRTMNNKVHNRRRHQGPKETLLNTEESL
jgi:hypothetical protein